jgi:hypothetical protein
MLAQMCPHTVVVDMVTSIAIEAEAHTEEGEDLIITICHTLQLLQHHMRLKKRKLMSLLKLSVKIALVMRWHNPQKHHHKAPLTHQLGQDDRSEVEVAHRSEEGEELPEGEVEERLLSL